MIGEGVQLVHQPFGMDPAQRVPAHRELPGIVAQHHGITQEVVRVDAAPDGAFGGDLHRVWRRAQNGEAKPVEMRRPCGLIGKGRFRLLSQPGDQGGGGVILSRGHAAEALAWTDRVMTRLGLTLNRTKTCLRDARQERFHFLGYSLGPHCFRQTGRWFIGASPSKKSVQRLKDKVSAMLVPGNMGEWTEVRDGLNRLLRGWSGYFSPGSHYTVDRAVEAHLYDRVRNFLARRHKLPTRGSRRFSMRQYSALWACCVCACAEIPTPAREPATKPVGKPDAGNPHVRFDERGGETDRDRGTAPLLDSTVRILLSCLFAGPPCATR